MLRSSLLAAMMLAFSGGVGAAGLGRVSVLSALGQPLRAEVEISASAEELETMSAKVASPDAFQRANIEYSGVFSAVRMSIEKSSSGKKAILKIASTKPFSEPFVDLLVELNWAGGRLLREYTFLLDPSSVQPDGQKPVLQVEEPVVKPLAGKPSKPSRRKESALPVESQTPPRETGEAYTVKRGDTLSKVATAVKPVEVSQEQMIAALYKVNAEAFVGGNINRLRTGKVLRVPDAEQAQQISRKEAHKILIKASSFEDYRDKVGAQVAASSAKDVGGSSSSSGKIEPKVEDKLPGTAAQKDKVKITSTQQPGKAESQAGGDSASKVRVQALQDELATRDKALKEANSRVSDLEKNVEALKKLIELKSQELAKAQQGATDAKKKPGKEVAASLPVEKAIVVEASKPAEEVAASSPVEAGASSPTASVSEPLESASSPVSGESAPVASVSKPVEVFAPVVEEKPADEGGTSPWLWVALGFVGLTGAYVWFQQRRRRNAGDLSQLSEISTTSPNSVFGNAVGQTIDTGGTSLLHTDFSQSGMAAIDADEGVDPVAEADVYMAYGRDAQAEEILLDALKTDPNRAAIYLKLLEIYAQRNSVKQFENVANDLHVRTHGTGDDWEKAVALGMKICPDHPLFRATPASAAVPAELPVEPEMPVPEPKPAEPAVSFGTNDVSQMRSTWTMPGDIGQVAVEGGAEEPKAETPVPEALNLDFNLDLETPEPEETPTRIEPREEPVVPVVPEPSSEEASVQSVPLEFDIGFDEEAAVRTSGIVPPVTEPQVRASLASLEEDEDIGIESVAPGSVAEVDLEKTNFEGSLLDFDFELGEEENKPTLDLSGVELCKEVAQGSSAPAVASAPALAESAFEIGDSIDVDDEVSTKLELAKAYEEMGDVEGARELLEEVLKDGNEAQKSDAQAMIQRLGA